MFMHGGWMHLIGNMWFLWIFGNNVEDAMGHFRFVLFYLLCGISAAALQTALDPNSVIPMVGASGAIGGVMGAYVLMYPRVHVHLFVFLGFYATTFAVPAYFMLGYWFLVQLVSGSVAIGAQGGGVAFWAHVGGFVAGALLSLVFRNREMLARHPYYGWKQQAAPTQKWGRVQR
jgi:membrane associated rhomboid family serine protease